MSATERGYAETLWPPVSWWAGGLMLVAAVWWAFFVATSAAIALVAAAGALALVGAGLAAYGRARVAVDDAGVHAGRAVLPWRYVGHAEPLTGADTRRTLGVDADARAYLLVRPYVTGAVRVAVEDSRDPAPYWLISTRRPALLADRLNSRVMQD